MVPGPSAGRWRLDVHHWSARNRPWTHKVHLGSRLQRCVQERDERRDVYGRSVASRRVEEVGNVELTCVAATFPWINAEAVPEASGSRRIGSIGWHIQLVPFSCGFWLHLLSYIWPRG